MVPFDWRGYRRGQLFPIAIVHFAPHPPIAYGPADSVGRSIHVANTTKTESAGSLSGRAIVTIIGSDRVGIIAGISGAIAEANVNILDISQSVIREFFTMIMMVDIGGATMTFEELSQRLARKGEELGVRVEIQREEIFKAMHRV
ncbi:ACT domain-containing protein [Rhodoplanes sp. Z2-YC6860]|nr:ACT domain-containing protein [Rhodoplanes sp. Z2-YC6860]